MLPPNLMRLLSVGLFIGVMFSVMGSTHYYLWARLVRDPQLPQPLHGFLSGMFVLFALGMPVGLAALGRMPWPPAKFLLGVLYAWMGLVFFALWIRGGLEIAQWAAGHWPPAASAMVAAGRLQVARVLAAIAAVLATATVLYAFRITRLGPVVEQVEVTLPRLPQALDGFRLVQLSDLHVAPYLGADYIRTVVARSNALHPEAVVITGDLVDGAVADMGDTVALLRGLQGPQGVYFITGNHEYYSGADAWIEFVRTLGIRVLRNERVAVGRGAATFDLAGIDDWTAHKFGHGHGADLPRAVAGRDGSRELVLLAHQPRAIYEAHAHGVGLMLSGHTHGGQMWPFGYIVRLVQPYLSGLDRYKSTQVYVNRGTGYWGPPLRFGATPEITLLTLRAPTHQAP
jgi:hypothetical protein